MLGYRLVLAPRLATPRWLALVTLGAGVLSGLVLCGIFLIAFGVPAADLGNEFIVYVFGDVAGLDQTLTRFIPLVLAALAVAMCLRVRFWNIGVEGQMWLGAIGATAVTLYDFGPWWLRMPLMVTAALLGGAAWCGIAAAARLWLRADEVITTLLLNYIGYLLAQHLLYGAWRNPVDSFPVSRMFKPYEQLPSFGSLHLHAGILFAAAAVLLCWWLCRYARFGLLSRAVAANPLAARALGVPVARTILLAACLAGALSGLAGFAIVAGEEHKLTQFVANDYIFPAFAIAYLGRSDPLGVVIAALGIAGLYTAGDSLKAFYQLPDTVVVTMESLLLLTVASFDVFLRYRIAVLRGVRPTRAARSAT